ncbi:DUF397 domain-containing protein [Streptomyces celluloflavus]|uniref:DUF397 domain-containing protein n=1 Tax=Streptomyces celluloflavus TaxID=58344 RepID=UPI00367F44FF
MADESAWFKSSYSNDTGGSCVEIADLNGKVGIRDSKDPHGPAFVLPVGSWSNFIRAVTNGEFGN